MILSTKKTAISVRIRIRNSTSIQTNTWFLNWLNHADSMARIFLFFFFSLKTKNWNNGARNQLIVVILWPGCGRKYKPRSSVSFNYEIMKCWEIDNNLSIAFCWMVFRFFFCFFFTSSILFVNHWWSMGSLCCFFIAAAHCTLWMQSY